MIYSMTGFARREAKEAWGSLVWEGRSVNHRYLETGWRLPEDLRSVETQFRQIVRRRIRRGKVECSLRLRWSGEIAGGLVLDEGVLDGLVKALGEAGSRLPDRAPVSPLEILRWPGVVTADERETEPVRLAAIRLLEEALEDLRESRREEGDRLGTMLIERCDGLESLVGKARVRIPEVRDRQREKLLSRIEQLDLSTDADRLEQELVILAQKMDIDEELDRLRSHIEEVRRIVAKEEPAGRRLDFLMQEFNREANTLASKSQDKETTNIALEMKVLIEQMREQVQNIE